MAMAMSYGERFSSLARDQPDLVAMVYAATDGSQTEHTWRELDRRSDQVATLLADRGLRQGRLLAIGLQNSPEHIIAAHAAWKLGATTLPFRADLPDWERSRLLAVAEPDLVIGAATDADPGNGAGAGSGDASLVSLAELRATADGPRGPFSAGMPRPVHAITSSGSTGSPKLIISDKPGSFDPDAPVNPMTNAKPGQIQLVTSPLYHTNGFMCHQRLLAGARIILMQKFDAAQAVALIEQHQVTQAIMVPTMLQRIAALPDVSPERLRSLTHIFYGGAPLSPVVARQWLDLIGAEHFYFQYGGSESIGLTMADGNQWLAHPGTAGLPLNCRVKILDDSLRELPAGEVGGIFLKPDAGPPPFRYKGSAPPAFSDDGFSTYGDLGYLDAEGYLYVVDRRVDMIVSGGANVFPAEVELALSEHPAVADVVVIGLPDPEWGRRVHAVVEFRPASAASAEELRAHCKSMLAAYKVPKSFDIVDAMPRTPAGKINRAQLARDTEAQVSGR